MLNCRSILSEKGEFDVVFIPSKRGTFEHLTFYFPEQTSYFPKEYQECLPVEIGPRQPVPYTRTRTPRQYVDGSTVVPSKVELE